MPITVLFNDNLSRLILFSLGIEYFSAWTIVHHIVAHLVPSPVHFFYTSPPLPPIPQSRDGGCIRIM